MNAEVTVREGGDLSVAGAITIDKGQTEGLYPLNASGDAMIGKWPMMVIGALSVASAALAAVPIVRHAQRPLAINVPRSAHQAR